MACVLPESLCLISPHTVSPLCRRALITNSDLQGGRCHIDHQLTAGQPQLERVMHLHAG